MALINYVNVTRIAYITGAEIIFLIIFLEKYLTQHLIKTLHVYSKSASLSVYHMLKLYSGVVRH